MKVFKRGGFIIVDNSGVESPIPVTNFDYKISFSTVKIHDVGENIVCSEDVANIQDEFGVPVGNATAIGVYFASLTAVSVGGGDASASNQLTQISELQTIETNTSTNATATKQDTQIAELQKLTGSNSPTHQELTNPSATVVSSFKKLSFICTGAISVVIDGNTITYPQNLGGGSKIYGATFEADDISTNSATFTGTGSVFLTIKQ